VEGAVADHRSKSGVAAKQENLHGKSLRAHATCERIRIVLQLKGKKGGCGQPAAEGLRPLRGMGSIGTWETDNTFYSIKKRQGSVQEAMQFPFAIIGVGRKLKG